MLRVIVVCLGAALLASSAALTLAVPGAWPVAVECAIFGVLILAGTLLERHYQSRRPATGAAWQTTGERFLDPSSGQFTEVRYNPETGERSYEPSDTERFPKI
jgi:hypothetical protein